MVQTTSSDLTTSSWLYKVSSVQLGTNLDMLVDLHRETDNQQ
jgi:hypothetical protein